MIFVETEISICYNTAAIRLIRDREPSLSAAIHYLFINNLCFFKSMSGLSLSMFSNKFINSTFDKETFSVLFFHHL